MKPKQFLSQLDHDRIVAAIADAERQTSGEIRVFVSRRAVNDAIGAAARQFEKLQMQKTGQRNAVLIFVAPRSQTFSIIGDQAIHAKCGDSFWNEVAGEMTGLLKQQKFTDGIVHGIQTSGRLLALHFPCKPDDRNELPDSVVEK